MRSKFLSMLDERENWPLSSTSKHLKTLKGYADECQHVVEVGMENGNTTVAFLASKAPTVITYDIGTDFDEVRGCGEANPKAIEEFKKICEEEGRFWEFRLGDSRKVQVPKTELLYIDTHHYYQHLKEELALSGNQSSKYIILHDTEIYKHYSTEGRDPDRGLSEAMSEFMAENPHWSVYKHYPHQFGLTVLKRT